MILPLPRLVPVLPLLLMFLVLAWPSGSVSAMDEPPGADRASISSDDLAFFENRIRPVLVQHCYECHAADASIVRGGLLLDSRGALMRGGDSGPGLVPEKPDESLLIQALRYEGHQMPPDGQLPAPVIADFEEWVRRGAPDPRQEVRSAKLQPVDWDAARKHWAFQPIVRPTPPESFPAGWVRNDIDRFVLAELQRHNMQPAPIADKLTLLRRAHFDLLGLPPRPEDVQAFLADESPEAFDRVIDQLLASPHYGERWGRHWLDLVRYATTNGADENHALPNAWRYRDWVVRMLNQDLPFDQFLIQQLAGDLLPAPTNELAAGDQLTATGLLVIGPKMLAEQDKDKMVIDIVDEQLDTISRTMLGLTIGCARCHDHKFDPIAARDYYSLAGIFYSTQSMQNRDFVSQWLERPLPSAAITARRSEHQQKIEAARTALAALKSPADDAAIATARQALEQLEKELPQFEMVMAADEAEPTNLPVHLRGNHLKPGPEKIPRGMPQILTEVAPASEIPAETSGRLEFARWLVSPQQPLTTRVMANRIWMWHFGKPLMRSPSNWGLQAEPPSHPELLDWLAAELPRNGWSLKALHRTILQSATWQMSSNSRSDYAELDPENRRLWRQNRRRLEAEAVRDSILLVGGGLDLTFGGIADSVDSHRRAIYLPVDRSALYEVFSTFDYVETGNHLEQRPVTTVPNQALFLMNSPLVHEQSRRLISQLPTHDPLLPLTDAGPVVNTLFERLYGRPVGAAECRTALEFVAAAELTMTHIPDPNERRQQAWAALARTLMAGNEFLYVP